MKLLHLVNTKGGGIGAYLSILESLGEEVREVKKEGLPRDLEPYDAVVVHGVIPKVHELPVPKAYYFHGLRGVSRRMIMGKVELNPLHLLRFRSFKNYLRNFDVLIFPTEAMKKRALSLYGFEGHVLYLPFEYPMKELEVIPRGKSLLWVGRKAWIKGLDTLLYLAKRLKNWSFFAVGVEKVIDIPNLRAMGEVNKEALNKLYTKATFTLITSYYESFSYVTLESMASGTPVLALERAEGAAELIRKVGLGRVFPTPRDMETYLKNYTGEIFKSKDVKDLFSPSRHLRNLQKLISTS